jgi:hypothetical protein
MYRPRVAAKSKARSREATLKNRIEAAPTAADNDDPTSSDSLTRHQRTGPGVRLWGFVRRQEDAQETIPGSDLLPKDISLWYDRNESRFQVISDQKVIDDLAPIEFAQFVRAMRFSTSQVLFKFENRQDGTSGRPIRVWSRPI